LACNEICHFVSYSRHNENIFMVFYTKLENNKTLLFLIKSL
jgi:hypothetical protein